MPYLSNLDGIRSVAVMLVVASHLLLLLTGGAGFPMYSLHAMGHLGVAIFFVHTTLVLMASLQRHGAAPIPFFVRRIFRIYPLAVFVVLLIALLQFAAKAPIDTQRLLSNLFLVQNLTEDQPYIGPLWSLPYEVQMYLFLPALYLIARFRRSATWVVALWLIAVIIAATNAANLATFHEPGTNPSLLRYVPCFIPGALAYALTGRISQALSPLWLFSIVGGAVIFVPGLVAVGAPEAPTMWGVCLALGLIIPACRDLDAKPVAKAANVIATYSYGIYLTHALVLGAVDKLLIASPLVGWTALLILLPGLPFICYHAIEKRGIALGSRFAAKLLRRKDLSTPASSEQASGF